MPSSSASNVPHVLERRESQRSDGGGPFVGGLRFVDRGRAGAGQKPGEDRPQTAAARRRELGLRRGGSLAQECQDDVTGQGLIPGQRAIQLLEDRGQVVVPVGGAGLGRQRGQECSAVPRGAESGVVGQPAKDLAGAAGRRS